MIELLRGTYDGWSYEFDINRKITLLCGNSGTGKTYFYDLCVSHFKLDYDNIQTCNGEDGDISTTLNNIKELHDQLFIFDHADRWTLTHDIRQAILQSNNQFVIVGRAPNGLLLFPDNMKQIRIDLNSQKAWFENII